MGAPGGDGEGEGVPDPGVPSGGASSCRSVWLSCPGVSSGGSAADASSEGDIVSPFPSSPDSASFPCEAAAKYVGDGAQGTGFEEPQEKPKRASVRGSRDISSRTDNEASSKFPGELRNRTRAMHHARVGEISPRADPQEWCSHRDP